MNEMLVSLADYGSALVFLLVLVEQLGLPIPSALVLVGAGAMVGQGLLSGPAVVGLALLGAVLPNYLWYRIGRAQGYRVLGLLCRISLDADACVRVTETLFARVGLASLVIAKFVPGLNTLAPPLAGVLRVPTPRFLLLSTLGTVLWVAATVGTGAIFSDEIEVIAEALTRWGLTAGLLIAGVLVLWFGGKFLQRWWMTRRLRGARLAPAAAHALLSGAQDAVAVDLRHPLSQRAVPYTLPGALRIAPDELLRRHAEIARDRDVVLFCSWPSEATSARVALQLRKAGVVRVRPLLGGIEAWLEAKLPVEPIADSRSADAP